MNKVIILDFLVKQLEIIDTHIVEGNINENMTIKEVRELILTAIKELSEELNLKKITITHGSPEDLDNPKG